MASTQSKQQTVVTSVGVSLKLLPFFVQSLETLFGKKTGQTKKAAAQELFNAAALGTAAGFGLAGDQSTADMINVFRPVVSAQIDEVAAQLFPPTPVIVNNGSDSANNAAPPAGQSAPDPVLSNAG